MRFYSVLLCILATLGSLHLNAQMQKHVSQKERTVPKYLTSAELSVANIYQKVLPTVVTIFTTSNAYTDKGAIRKQGLGSGVLVSAEHILTAAHVVDGSSEIMIKTQDGQNRKATVVFSEKTADLALVALNDPAPELPHALLGNSDDLAVGQNVYAIGSPYGLENSFSSGIISSFRGFNQLYDGTVSVEFIQTDAAINSGNSGGPLFNSKGEVIGIASSILTVSGGFQGIGMVVAINTAKDLLAFEDRPWVGVDGVFLQKEEWSRFFNLDINGGLLVQRVAIGSPAHKSGLRGGFIKANVNGKDILFGGDIILSIDDQAACHVDCLAHSKERLKSKSKLDITYLREGKIAKVTIDVSENRKNFLVLE